MVAPRKTLALSLDEAKSLLSYDPETGYFYWLASRGRSKQGKRAGALKNTGYIEIKIRRSQYLAHRLAWFFVHGQWPSYQIDHINLDKSDNRICNLREANPSLNGANRRVSPKSASGLKGVYFNKSAKRWAAYIRVNGRGETIGYYDSPIDASAAYSRRAQEAFGDFSRSV